MSQTIECRRVGDYLLPNLTPPEKAPLGVWGLRRKEYLLKRKMGIYTALELSGKLDAHLAEVDRQAGEMFSLLVKQMAQRQGITEELKARDPLAWVGAMNNIRSATEEIVREELIYG